MSCLKLQVALSPIGSLSVDELERAATAPHRWIALSKNGNGDEEFVRSRTTRLPNVNLESLSCGMWSGPFASRMRPGIRRVTNGDPDHYGKTH
jgi:hypothetical protein